MKNCSFQIREIECKNETSSKYKIDRERFICLEVVISTESDWYKRVFSYAKQIEKKLNPGQANTSENRPEEIVEIDNLMGVIAEYACYDVLLYYYKDMIEKPLSKGSINQIDIMIAGTKKTIEVRSSCVKNGLDFALFSRPKENNLEQYFDIIGPYSNGYKPGETIKDYYMRVLYCCNKKNFFDMINQKIIKLYITGGVTREMMSNHSITQVKHLTPKGGEVKMESDYIVIPLGKSMDFPVFIETLKRDFS